MADEQLSAAEIEILTGRRPSTTAAAVARPSLFSGEPLERLAARLSALHEDAARQCAADWSALLRRSVRLRVAEAAWLPTRGFLQPASVYCRSLATAPQTEPWRLSLSASAFFPIIDCMLGGGRNVNPNVQRSPTQIESRLADRAVRLFLDALEMAWRPLVAVSLSTVDVAAGGNPDAVGHGPYLCVRFNVELASVNGELELGIPAQSLSRLLPKRSGAATNQTHDSQATLTAWSDEHPDGIVEIVACLAEAELAPDELAGLAVGDVITTDQAADDSIAVSRNGRPVFRARLGASLGHKAVEIDRLLPDGNVT